MLPRILLAVVALSVTGARTAPIHYKIETKTGTSMDMSAMGGEPMNIDMTAVSWVSITTRDSAGQQLLHVVLDSSTFAVQGMPGGADLPDMQAPNGTAIDFAIVDGKVTWPNAAASVGSMTTSPGIGFVVMAVGLIYPTNMRAGVKLGDHWVDTVSTDTTTAMGKGTSTQIRKWSATVQDGAALLVDNEITGTMRMGDGLMNMTTTGAQHLAIVPRGSAHNASGVSKTSMTMNVPNAGSIQMATTSTVTVTVIK